MGAFFGTLSGRRVVKSNLLIPMLLLASLGACDSGPCALVNEKLHENLMIENFERILDSLE